MLKYAFLTEFDLLRFSQEDIWEKQWAQPGICEATAKYFKVKGAHAEIQHLNVEIKRLVTSIRDEAMDYPIHIGRIHQRNPGLADVIAAQWSLWHQVNELHMSHLANIANLQGFSGCLVPGARIGYKPPATIPLPAIQPLSIPVDPNVQTSHVFPAT